MSTSHQRDADMDRLLRAVLKPAPRQPDATGFEAGPSCPDAGVLAAFVEGGLTAAEQSALDAHIVGCGRCQEALAVLSHDLPHEGEEAAALESGWFTWVTRPRLRWLVPISAAATVAALFVATRPLIAPEGDVPATEVTRMAQAPVPPAELPAAGKAASREESAVVPEKSEFAGSPERQEAGRRQADRLAGARQAADAQLPTMVGQAATGEKALAEAVAAKAEPAAPPAADAMRAMPAALPAGGELRGTQPLAIVNAPPDGMVRWRFGPGGRIWQSADAGSTWHAQVSGVSADLVAGSAPSATTCWAVGTAGVVLLSEDGQRWTLLPFPLKVDLAAVQAANSRIATVTTRDGRRFETLDAGLTWSPK